LNMQKHIAGLALFIFIVISSVYILGIVAAPLRMIPPVPLNAPSPPSVTVWLPVSYRVHLVSLDFNTQTSYTTLTLKREGNNPAPDKLWVNTTFFVPEWPGERWSNGAVEIREPFANGRNEATPTVVAGFPWRDDASVLRAGYYAIVTVSTVSADDAARRAEQTAADIKTAAPVLVQVERKPGLQ
jgi:hypothetical protein